MKRILTFILALTMLISPQYFVNAQENIEIIVNETFNDAPTNGLPSSVTTTGTGSLMDVKELEKGKALYLRNRWSDTSARVKAVLSEDALKFGGAGAASKDIVWADTSILLPDFNTDRNVIEIVIKLSYNILYNNYCLNFTRCNNILSFRHAKLS